MHLLVINFVLLFLGLRKWIQEDLSSKAADAFEKVTGKFAKACLCLWDYSLQHEDMVNTLKVWHAVAMDGGHRTPECPLLGEYPWLVDSSPTAKHWLRSFKKTNWTSCGRNGRRKSD